MDGVTVTAIARTFAVTIVTSPATGERSNMIAGNCVAICVVATMLRLRVSERKCAPAIVTWIATTVMSTATSGTCTGIVTGTVAKIQPWKRGKEGSRCCPLVFYSAGFKSKRLSAAPAGLSGLQRNDRIRSHLRVHPTVNKFLQAGLAAKVFGGSVVRQHVFPGIDLEHLASRSIIMWTVRLAPGQPPMVDAAFLLSANIAIEGLRPGHSSPRSETVAQSYDGKQLPCLPRVKICCREGGISRGVIQ